MGSHRNVKNTHLDQGGRDPVPLREIDTKGMYGL